MNEIWLIVVMAVVLVAFTILWRQGAFLRLSAYWDETMDELKKCTWPTWDELSGSTVVVIVSVAMLGAFTVGVDLAVTFIMKVIV
jgi:preprotein translocase subunit SecE